MKIHAHGAGHYPCPPGFNGHLRPAYLWFSGRPLNGHRYTNATGFRYGTAATDISHRATAYQLLPGYKRFLYFRAPLMLAPAAAVEAVVDPAPTALTAAGIATLMAPKALAAWRTRTFRREVTEPVAAAAATVLKIGHEKGRGHRWVDVPENFRDDEHAKIRVDVPAGWVGDPGDQKRLTEVVCQRLQVADLSPSWQLHGASPHVLYAVPPMPPGLVRFDEAVDDLSNSDETAPMVGYGPRRRVVTFSLTLESPHLLIAGATNSGKSELLAAIVGQFMRRGYGVLVCDAKFTSHMWLRQIPEVAYCSEADKLHNALIWLDEELLRRARFVAAGGDPATLVPLVAVLEEINGASNRLRSYWKTIKTAADPMMSPALTALNNLASMGRELRIHILMAGQSVTGKASGGPETRENFGGRTLGGATANQWRMLAPQIKPAPVKRKEPGRWHLVIGDTLTEYQAPFMDIKHHEDRLIGWATGGMSIPDVNAMMTQGRMPQDPWSEAVSSGNEPTIELVGLVSLSEYVERRPGLTLVQIRNWKARYAAEFPTHEDTRGDGAYLYLESKLDSFVNARREAQAAR